MYFDTGNYLIVFDNHSESSVECTASQGFLIFSKKFFHSLLANQSYWKPNHIAIFIVEIASLPDTNVFFFRPSAMQEQNQ